MINFNTAFQCSYQVCESIGPLVRRIVARNPGPFTFYGTGTYIIGRGEVAIVDPGPADPQHIQALLQATDNEKITHILVTHTHLDHSPGAAVLKKITGAPTFGYGPHGAGKHLTDDIVEAGADWEFVPDVKISDGEILNGKDWSVECVHTPGHTSNHICFQLRENKTLFCGDHVMAWSTSIISPPDGDLSDYLSSLRKLLFRDDEIFWPCHGPAIEYPRPFVQSFIDHRKTRIEEVVRCLNNGINSIGQMVPTMYQGLDKRMQPAAARSILSALIYLIDKNRVVSHTIGLDSIYQLT